MEVKGTDLRKAPREISEALEPYPDARIVSMTQKSNWATSLRGNASVLLVIDYTPDAVER